MWALRARKAHIIDVLLGGRPAANRATIPRVLNPRRVEDGETFLIGDGIHATEADLPSRVGAEAVEVEHQWQGLGAIKVGGNMQDVLALARVRLAYSPQL